MKIVNLLFKNMRQALSVLVVLMILFTANGASATAGVLDPTFGTNGSVLTDLGGNNDLGLSVLQQADGKILMSALERQDTTSTPVIVRFDGAGVIDSTFGVSGRLVSPTTVAMGTKIAIQPGGKLIVGGSINGSVGVLRFDSNGTTLDNTFGISGAVLLTDSSGFSRYSISDLAVDPDGNLVLAGTETNLGNFTNFVVVRLHADGTPYDTDFFNSLIVLDKTNFPNNRYNNGRAVAIQSDGKIVVSGYMMDDDAQDQISLARFNADGSLDTATFGTNGHGTVMVPLTDFIQSSSALAIQSDGKIVVAGSIVPDVSGNENIALARFNNNGSLDTTFGAGGVVITDLGKNERGNGLAIQSDGKLVMSGTSSDANGSDVLLARYNLNGSLDSTFGLNGITTSDFGNSADTAEGVIVQTDGRILAVGSSNSDALLARYDTASNVATTTITYKSIGNFDGWILESGEFTNTGGILNRLATVVNVGDDVRDRQYRSILSFNTISLPDNAVITSAQVKVKRQGVIGQDPFNTHGSLLLDTRLGLFSNGIALQLSDFNATSSAGQTADTITAATPLNWYSGLLGTSNRLLINKLGVTQFRLRFTRDDNDDMGADYVKFFSGESLDSNRPQLIISYYLP